MLLARQDSGGTAEIRNNRHVAQVRFRQQIRENCCRRLARQSYSLPGTRNNRHNLPCLPKVISSREVTSCATRNVPLQSTISRKSRGSSRLAVKLTQITWVPGGR